VILFNFDSALAQMYTYLPLLILLQRRERPFLSSSIRTHCSSNVPDSDIGRLARISCNHSVLRLDSHNAIFLLYISIMDEYF
jgi:hypothetical protein